MLKILHLGEEGQLQTIMKEVWLDVLEHKDCEEKLRKTKLGRFFILNETFLCAGGEADIDLCTVLIFCIDPIPS